MQYLASSSSTLLGQPSANLRRLIGYGVDDDAMSAFEIPNVDPAKLFRSPVLLFVLARRDIKAHEMKMEAAARVNAVRQYACEVRMELNDLITWPFLSSHFFNRLIAKSGRKKKIHRPVARVVRLTYKLLSLVWTYSIYINCNFIFLLIPQALNWLLRSATQPTCVHDVMWWFSETLSQYASSPPPSPVIQEIQEVSYKKKQIHDTILGTI